MCIKTNADTPNKSLTWLDLSDFKDDLHYYEIDNGVPIRVRPESKKHKDILDNFKRLLDAFVLSPETQARNTMSCQVFSENGGTEIPREDSIVHMRVADLLVVHDAFIDYYCTHVCSNLFGTSLNLVPLYRQFSMTSTRNPAPIHVEIASSLTHETDTQQKWREYAISKVPVYLIYEMPEASVDGEPRVICGSLYKISNNSLRSWDGRADTGVGSRPLNCDPELLQKLYYKTIFEADEFINISPASGYTFTDLTIADIEHSLPYTVEELLYPNSVQ